MALGGKALASLATSLQIPKPMKLSEAGTGTPNCSEMVSIVGTGQLTGQLVQSTQQNNRNSRDLVSNKTGGDP